MKSIEASIIYIKILICFKKWFYGVNVHDCKDTDTILVSERRNKKNKISR